MLKKFLLIFLLGLLSVHSFSAAAQMQQGIAISKSAPTYLQEEIQVEAPPPSVVREDKLVRGKPIPFFVSYFFALVDVDTNGKVIVTEQFKVVNNSNEDQKLTRRLHYLSDILEVAGEGASSSLLTKKAYFSVPANSMRLFSITYRDDTLFSKDEREDVLMYRLRNPFGIPIAYSGGTILTPLNIKTSGYRAQKEGIDGANASPAYAKTDQEGNVGFFVNEPLSSTDAFLMAVLIGKGQINPPVFLKFQRAAPFAAAVLCFIFLVLYLRMIPKRLLQETGRFTIPTCVRSSASHFMVTTRALASTLMCLEKQGDIKISEDSFVRTSEGKNKEDRYFLDILFGTHNANITFANASIPLKHLRNAVEDVFWKHIRSLFWRLYLRYYVFAALVSIAVSATLFYFNPIYGAFGFVMLIAIGTRLAIDYMKEMDGEGVLSVLIASKTGDFLADEDEKDDDRFALIEVLLKKILPQGRHEPGRS